MGRRATATRKGRSCQQHVARTAPAADQTHLLIFLPVSTKQMTWCCSPAGEPCGLPERRRRIFVVVPGRLARLFGSTFGSVGDEIIPRRRGASSRIITARGRTPRSDRHMRRLVRMILCFPMAGIGPRLLACERRWRESTKRRLASRRPGAISGPGAWRKDAVSSSRCRTSAAGKQRVPGFVSCAAVAHDRRRTRRLLGQRRRSGSCASRTALGPRRPWTSGRRRWASAPPHATKRRWSSPYWRTVTPSADGLEQWSSSVRRRRASGWPGRARLAAPAVASCRMAWRSRTQRAVTGTGKPCSPVPTERQGASSKMMPGR